MRKGQMVITLSTPAIDVERKKKFRHAVRRKTFRLELMNSQVAVAGISLRAPEALAKVFTSRVEIFLKSGGKLNVLRSSSELVVKIVGRVKRPRTSKAIRVAPKTRQYDSSVTVLV